MKTSTTFTYRRWVTESAEGWLEARGLPVTPFNIVTALDAIGLLNNPPTGISLIVHFSRLFAGIKDARERANEINALPGQSIGAKDPQCDGCRWSWPVFDPSKSIEHPGHCYMFENRMEECRQNERQHQP